ncbi:MAG TPA: hypothetical protein VES03_01425 [Motilibacterales bacterium]|nr:hypothetical protein [Motilibacterales bacterium]
MNSPALMAPARRTTTTYAQLTERAARRIARAHVLTTLDRIDHPRCPAWDVAAHRDLAAALVHLGRTLTRPLAGSAPTLPRRRRGGPDARLLRSLESLAGARDWSEPVPAEGPAAALAEAAFLIRSAADLWATHHSTDGHPRSPEASRMRHPSTLGAASREWRTLVSLTSQTAAVVASGAPAGALTDNDLAVLREFPRPREDPESPAPVGLLDLTVARPGIRPGQRPLDELADRVDRLRHLAWTLAEVGSAPATVLGNLAAIARAVHRAAAHAHQSLALAASSDRERDRHLEEARISAEAQSMWQDVAGQVRELRTPHASAHPIQIERLDIDRLLSRAVPSGARLTRPEVGWALSRIAGAFTEIAAQNARALRTAHDRGDLLLVGRAIPTEALPRRPDLLEARLRDQVIPAPTVVVTRLESTYRALARRPRAALAPEISPPAA